MDKCGTVMICSPSVAHNRVFDTISMLFTGIVFDGNTSVMSIRCLAASLASHPLFVAGVVVRDMEVLRRDADSSVQETENEQHVRESVNLSLFNDTWSQ